MRNLGSSAVSMLHPARDTRRSLPVRLLSAAALAAASSLAACGGGGDGTTGITHPTLDATTVSASATRLQAVTSQPVIAAMITQGAAAGLPSFARNVARVPTLAPRLGSRLIPNAARLAPLASLATPRGTPGASHAILGSSTALIPDSLLGKTLVPDATGLFTVSPTRTGAPSNGVRFVVRVPGTTQDIGYADLTENVTGATSSLTLDINNASGVLVMHNVESTTVSGSNETDAFGGYATNGTDRIDYTVDVQSTGSRTTATTSVTSASANVAVADTSIIDGMAASDVDVSRITVGSTVVRITTPMVADTQHGGYTESATSSITVNGADFARLVVSPSGTPSLTAPDGTALSSSDMDALMSVQQILVAAGTMILAPVVVVVWLLIATSAY